MAKFTDAVEATMVSYFNAGDQPTEAQFTALMAAIQAAIDEHDHTQVAAGDGLKTLGPLADVWLEDGAQVGIAGNELLTVNAAGNFTFSGITSLAVPNGCWVGADANASWMFDTANNDVTTLDKVGVGTRTPTYDIDVYRASTNAIIRAVQTGAGNFFAGFLADGDDAQISLSAYDDAYADVAEYAGKTVWQSGGGHLTLVALEATGEIQMYTGGRAAANKRFVLEDDGQLKNTATGATMAGTFFNDGNHIDRHVLELQGGADDGAAVGTTYFVYARDGDGGPTGCLKTVNGVFQLADISDECHKANIKDTRIVGLDIVNKLRVRDFNWKGHTKDPVMTSFVAQEAQEVYPAMVGEALDGTLMTSRGLLIPILVKAIQEQQAQIKQLQEVTRG